MKTLSTAIIALTLTAAAGAAPKGQDWPGWRGPAFNGASTETGLPDKFSPTENVKWSVELPGESAATPIVVGDNIYLSSVDKAAQSLLAMCLDRKTGQVKWKHDVGSGYRPSGMGNAIQLDGRSNYASPSPVSDGKRVVFFYGNGDFMAFDLAGKKLWTKNMQKEYGDFCFGFTFSSTPLLYKGKLYFQLLQRDHPVSGRGSEGMPSWLIAFDPATGKELWKAERPTTAKMESREAFSSPIAYSHGGRDQILIAGGDLLSGHDPATGKELWRWGTWNQNNQNPAYRIVPSPVGGAGVVLGCGPKREPVFAVKADSNGDVTEKGPLWATPKPAEVTTDVPSPLFYNGKFYVVSDLRKNISCLEPATGQVLWTTALPGPAPVWASPTGADGKIYLLSLRGEAFVVDAKSGAILSTAMMADNEYEIRSCVVPAHGNLFIRTNSRLFCIGK